MSFDGGAVRGYAGWRGRTGSAGFTGAEKIFAFTGPKQIGGSFCSVSKRPSPPAAGVIMCHHAQAADVSFVACQGFVLNVTIIT